MDALFDDVLIDPGPYQESFESIHVPPTLISQYERPDKSEVLCAHLISFCMSLLVLFILFVFTGQSRPNQKAGSVSRDSAYQRTTSGLGISAEILTEWKRC